MVMSGFYEGGIQRRPTVIPNVQAVKMIFKTAVRRSKKTFWVVAVGLHELGLELRGGGITYLQRP